jgi:uncharacterized lipoprotein YddW (UPF0748 family)
MLTTAFRRVAFLSFIVVMTGCTTFAPRTTEPTASGPRIDREFRGAWVATVGNIDWPSTPGLSTEAQQREARAILDTAVALGLNAIVFQVRPHCDAMYRSDLEPWSHYLTGTQAQAPSPYYDPLEFWVDEAHDRGLELHAWFNPYRAHLSRRNGEPPPTSLVNTKPHLVRKLQGNTWWMDPGHPETQDHSFNVVMDVVRRYDVDGIHFDDYFYPYGDGNFPDDTTWAMYQASGGKLARNDWRRSNVNTFIERLHKAIKKEKSYVKFGLSPFGIWRPGNPPSIAGFDQYNGLFADAKLWWNEGWVDYFTPQLYWPIRQVPQSFPVLMGWWTRENREGRHLWPGLYTGRMIGDNQEEIPNQIMIARGFVPDGPGHIHFSFRSFQRESTLVNGTLKSGVYRTPAIVPPSPWLDDDPPAAPNVAVTADSQSVGLAWTHPDESDVFRWIVYARYNQAWEPMVQNRYSTSTTLSRERAVEERSRRRGQADSVRVRLERLQEVAVSAVDRVGNESPVHIMGIQ